MRFRRRGEAVAHIDRWAGVHLVLDLGLGEGGAVVDAPVDRLEAAIDEAFFKKAVEGFESAGLVVAGHGFVGRIPAAEAADAHELRGLQIDVFLRVGAACIQHRRDRHLKLFAAELLVDLDFDGQAVAVEAGNIGCIEAGHGLRLDDEILEAVVERVTQVDGTVGVGRAVVKDVGRATLAGLAQLVIEAQRSPASEPKWFIMGQIRLHGKAV